MTDPEVPRGQLVEELDALRAHLASLEQTELEHQEAEARLLFQARLLDRVRESVVVTDLEGVIIYWSKGAEVLYGYSSEEAMGKTKSVYVDPHYEEEEQNRLQQACGTGAWYGQCMRKRKDGTLFWADTVLSLAVDDNDEPHGLVAIERDITELKQAEEELQKRATRFELIQHISQMMTAILELDPLLHKTVELIGDTFGYYSTQILLVESSEIVVTATTHPSLKSQEGRLRLRVGSEGITGWVAANGEPLLVPNVRQDGRFRFTEEMEETRSELAVPIKLMGRVIGVLDIQDTEPNTFGQEDISTLQTIADQAAIAIENARLYEANQRYTQDLQDLVAEQTADVQAVNERLLALSRVKDEFVSNVSHELRTPIASLQLYLELLARFPEKTETYLDTLQRETDRLAHIIDGLLDLSRLDQGQAGASMQTIDLNELVHLNVADRPLLAETRGLTLTLEMQPNLPPTEADPKLIGQALSILLTNAFNYTPAGGWVKVATRTHTAKGRQWVGFTVSDNGPGISPDDQARIFDRFFRGEAGRVSGVPGTGLGLAIVKEVVERHQGWIEVESEGAIGKGANFGVWMPAKDTASDSDIQNTMGN